MATAKKEKAVRRCACRPPLRRPCPWRKRLALALPKAKPKRAKAKAIGGKAKSPRNVAS
jgi:hypothetical protein